MGSRPDNDAVPCDCYVINLQLRPGGSSAALPVAPVMTLVEATGTGRRPATTRTSCTRWNRATRPSSRSNTYPGRIIKGQVDSIVWAQGAGQVQASGTLPMTGVLAAPAQRFAVKFDVADKDKDLFLAAGAAGDAAIYTEHAAALQILRKVILRVGSYTNYLILKLRWNGVRANIGRFSAYCRCPRVR